MAMLSFSLFDLKQQQETLADIWCLVQIWYLLFSHQLIQ